MKKGTLALLLVLMGVVFISSCSKTDPPPVTPKTASFYAVNSYSSNKDYILFNLQSGYKDKNGQYILIDTYGDLDYNASTTISEVDYKTVGGEICFFYRDNEGTLWRVDPIKLEAGVKTPFFINQNTRKGQIQLDDLPKKVN